MENIWT